MAPCAAVLRPGPARPTCAAPSRSSAARASSCSSRSLRLRVDARRTVSGKRPTVERLAPPKPQQQPSPQQPRPPPRPKKPKPWIFADGLLLLGDLVMIAATEVSSERIQHESLPVLTGVSLVCWGVSAAALGDYRGVVPHSDNWYLSLLGPAFIAVVDSTITWAVSVTASLAVFSILVSSNVLDAAPMVEDLATENLSPQLEVAVAALITMACWRGIAAKLRSR